MPAGAGAGKALTKIGRTGTGRGDHSAARPANFIAHVEGDAFPMVNGHNLVQPPTVNDKEVIERRAVKIGIL